MVERLEQRPFDENKIYNFCVNDRVQRRKTAENIIAENERGQADNEAQVETLRLSKQAFSSQFSI
jgi:hypothetical protein